MSEPVCTYCHAETFPVVDGGWVCARCRSTIGKEAPTPEPRDG